MEKEEFKCEVCGKECEELFRFGIYYDKDRNFGKPQVEDDLDYCEKHFREKEQEYQNQENF